MSNDKQRNYTPITGNPRRRTRNEKENPTSTNSPTRTSSSETNPKKSRARERKRRVQVTPRDWKKVEAISEELGLPYSKVYNMAFSTLLEKLGRK